MRFVPRRSSNGDVHPTPAVIQVPPNWRSEPASHAAECSAPLPAPGTRDPGSRASVDTASSSGEDAPLFSLQAHACGDDSPVSTSDAVSRALREIAEGALLAPVSCSFQGSESTDGNSIHQLPATAILTSRALAAALLSILQVRLQARMVATARMLRCVPATHPLYMQAYSDDILPGATCYSCNSGSQTWRTSQPPMPRTALSCLSCPRPRARASSCPHAATVSALWKCWWPRAAQAAARCTCKAFQSGRRRASGPTARQRWRAGS